jgi:hypothetical protein
MNEMTNSLARVPDGRSGVTLVHGNDDITVLDPQSGDLRESGPRVDTIATVSLGYKSEKGYPVASREKDERWLHAHDADDAPALLDALKAGNYRHLTISLASDSWGEIVQQHHAAYSASALQVYGDHEALTYITRQPTMDPRTNEQAKDDKGALLWEPLHVTVKKADDPEMYARMLKICKVQTSIYFYLAEWTQTDDGWLPQVVMDGDVGLYRLRTTGTHTVENLASTVKQIRGITGGFIKGVPLTLSVSFPEVSGPDGKKRKVPVCTFRLQPPYRITGVNFRPMLEAAVTEGQALALPAPSRERMEDEEHIEPLMPDVVTADEQEVALLARGGRCPVGRYTRIFFSMTRGTELDGDDARARLVRTYSNGRTASLAELLHWSTDEEAQAFIAYVDEQLNGPEDPQPERPAMPSNEYERLHAPYEDLSPLASPLPSIRQRQQVQPDGSVVDTTSGEIVHDASQSTAEPIDTEGREIESQTDERLEALGASLDELIGHPSGDAVPPEPPDEVGQVDSSDSLSTNEGKHGEQESELGSKDFDYGMCMELFTAHPELTLDKPLPRLKPAAYEAWHAKFVKALEAHDDVPF